MTDTPKTTPIKVTSGPISAPDPMEALRAKEAELLAERVALLEAQNAELRSKPIPLKQDPRSRAIAAQMGNLDEAMKPGVVHISAFDKAGVDYKGKEEDLANLDAALQD